MEVKRHSKRLVTNKVISLFKKRNKCSYVNYRKISLLDAAYKIYAKILNKGIKVITEELIGEDQTGFRKLNECHIYISTNIWQSNRKKMMEYNLMMRLSKTL